MDGLGESCVLNEGREPKCWGEPQRGGAEAGASQGLRSAVNSPAGRAAESVGLSEQ